VCGEPTPYLRALRVQGIYKAFSSGGNPTVSKVAKALGLQITVQAAH